MDCPSCCAPLIAVERHRIEVDWCPECRGIWFDGGELRLLSKSVGSPHDRRDFIDLPAADSQELPRRCPRCRGKMDKILVGENDHPVFADRCPRGDGLWFDKGELGRAFGKLGEVVNFLGETLGKTA